jgi:hypothetical protein
MRLGRSRAGRLRPRHPPAGWEPAPGRSAGLLVGVLLALILALPALAQAQTFTITNLENSGAGSLREAVKEANAAAGVDTIDFAPELTGTISLSGTGLTITDAVDIVGPGAGALTIQQLTVEHRVFKIELATPGPVTISGLGLTGGSTPGRGGDVDDVGGTQPLTIEDCLITDGASEEIGGGIYSESPLRLLGSTVSGNRSQYQGAGLSLNAGFTLIGSTISGNISGARDTGGMTGDVDQMETGLIEDSTISGNQNRALELVARGTGRIVVRDSTVADNVGGVGELATFGSGSFAFVGDTIADNDTVNSGPGIYIEPEGGNPTAATFEDTLLSANTKSTAEPEIEGPFSAAFSLIGDALGGLELTEVLPGSNLLGVDPQLGPLADNGGPTQTMALPVTSPAVNSGAAFGLPTDQRDDPRPVAYPGISASSAPGSDSSDIGAYELQAPSVSTTQGAPPSTPPPPAGALPAEGSPRVRVSCPKSAGHGGCRFALQVVAARPRRAGGRGRRAKPPVPESAVARVKLGAGRSALVTLTPKPRFRARLDAAKSLLLREVETAGGRTHSAYRRLKVLG